MDRFRYLSNSSKTLAKHRKVRILSSPLQNPGFPRVFRISGQFLWSSVAPMLARCMASCGACISRRAPKFESFYESRWVAKTLRVLNVTVWHRSTPVEAVGFELSERCSEKWMC
jgi:hypothetical protein